jgi:hypothetical protein
MACYECRGSLSTALQRAREQDFEIRARTGAALASAANAEGPMTQAPIENEKEVSEICVQCGMCCSGVLFDYARLEESEVDFARSISLTVEADSEEPDARKKFTLPCPHLCGSACSIYTKPRPQICSRFFCELAKSLDRGEVSQAESLAVIAEAKRMMSLIEPLLKPGENWPMARSRWHAARNKPPQDGTEAQFQVLMTALNLLFDRHFLKESKRRFALSEMK